MTALAGHHTRLPGTVPAERIVTPEIRRHPPELVERLLAIPDVISAVADALDELGTGSTVPGHRLPRAAGTAAVCGPALTLRYAVIGGDVTGNRLRGAGRVIGDRDLYGLAHPGDVAVMDGSAAPDLAILGGLSARWAALAGVAGCVLDGAVRDSTTLAEIGLPIWSAGRNPTCARYRMEAVEINGPVSLSGRLVRPGDYIVADDDGVCIVPHDDLPAVVAHCLDAARAERDLTALLTSASDVADVVAALRGRTAPA
jgi:regulator of RNase E activity RraA